MRAVLPCLLLIGCTATNTVPLITTFEDGVADSQVVPVRYMGSGAWLALDTGAPFTFLFADPNGPEYVEEGASVEIGCETWQVPLYGDEAIGVENFQGKPIVGVLGLDFFLDVPAEIDYPGGRLVRHLGGRLPASAAKLTELPLHGRENGRALIDVVIDHAGYTLMLDTGAHVTLLIDAACGEGGNLMQVQTADGGRCDVYLGEAELSLPGEPPRRVPVMRAREFPYLEDELSDLKMHGLFGLTSLGWRRVVFDFNAGALRLGPAHRVD
jgi:hypothetical protein